MEQQVAQLLEKLDRLVSALTLLAAEQIKTNAALNALADAIAAPVEVPDERVAGGGDGIERDFEGNPVR